MAHVVQALDDHRWTASTVSTFLQRLLKKEVVGCEKKGKTKSEAQRQAEELQKEMERKQKELAECLKVLEAKKELSAKRTRFIETLDQINTAEDVLNEDDTFEVSNYRLIFASSGAPSYREESIFKISNRELLLNFVEFIRDKINKKIAEIEAELVK